MGIKRRKPEPIDDRERFVGSLTLAALGAFFDGEERRKLRRLIERPDELAAYVTTET